MNENIPSDRGKPKKLIQVKKKNEKETTTPSKKSIHNNDVNTY